MAGSIRYTIILGNEPPEVGCVAFTESTSLDFILATGSADTAISLGELTTVDMLFIKSDQAISLNFQADTGTDIPIDANKPVLLTGTAITAVYGTNASGTNAKISLKLWGA